MGENWLIWVSIVILIVAAIGGVQLVDPAQNTSTNHVDFSETPSEYTIEALNRLSSTDHRARSYYNDSAAEYTTPVDHDLRYVGLADATDRQYRYTFGPRSKTPHVVYASVDGVWEYEDSRSPTSPSFREPRIPLDDYGTVVDPPDKDTKVTVVKDSSEIVVVRINGSVADGLRTATTFVTIEKATGNVRRIHQLTPYQNRTTHRLILYDRYGDVDVTRPPEAKYTLDVFFYDLQRGPISLHEVF